MSTTQQQVTDTLTPWTHCPPSITNTEAGDVHRRMVARQLTKRLQERGLITPDLPTPDFTGQVTTAWTVEGIRGGWGHDEESARASIDADMPDHITVRHDGDTALIIPKDKAVEFAHKILAASQGGS